MPSVSFILRVREHWKVLDETDVSLWCWAEKQLKGLQAEAGSKACPRAGGEHLWGRRGRWLRGPFCRL